MDVQSPASLCRHYSLYGKMSTTQAFTNVKSHFYEAI